MTRSIVIGAIAAALMAAWLGQSSPVPDPPGDVEQVRIKPCEAIYDPVLCKDGLVYPNKCTARNAGVHSCHPYEE